MLSCTAISQTFTLASSQCPYSGAPNTTSLEHGQVAVELPRGDLAVVLAPLGVFELDEVVVDVAQRTLDQLVAPQLVQRPALGAATAVSRVSTHQRPAQFRQAREPQSIVERV